MVININQIPPEGLGLEEDIVPAALDLDTDVIKFRKPIHVKAAITKITNAVTAELSVSTIILMNCSRCLNGFESYFKKDFRLNYQADKSVVSIDLNPDIRQEIILDYPLKPLCKPDCKGLCPECGTNLNTGLCACQKGLKGSV